MVVVAAAVAAAVAAVVVAAAVAAAVAAVVVAASVAAAVAAVVVAASVASAVPVVCSSGAAALVAPTNGASIKLNTMIVATATTSASDVLRIQFSFMLRKRPAKHTLASPDHFPQRA